MKAVYIEWYDAITKEGSWCSQSEAKEWAKSNQWVNKQLGFIVEENSEYILLAGIVGQMTEDEQHLRHITKIPNISMLKRVEIFSGGSVIPTKHHKCEHCGVWTTQPDDECYKNPNNK